LICPPFNGTFVSNCPEVTTPWNATGSIKEELNQLCLNDKSK
jgi:hypothetical protein